MTTTTEVRRAPTGTWQLDRTHSTIGFEVPYLVGTFKGQFREADAKLVVDGTTATIKGTAKVDSVDVKDENLSAHLQSPDFFDAERHPELIFSATDVDLSGDTVSAHGSLTIKGVTRPVDLTGRITDTLVDGNGLERVGLELNAKVNRHDFGVSWNMPLPTGEPSVGDEVTIVTELYFVKEA